MINFGFIDEIKNYIQKNGKHPSEWYVGIATDIKERLFGDHNVQEDGGVWIYNANPMPEQNARDTEKYLLENYDFDGGPGGGDNPRYVYAYKKTNYTVQRTE